MNTFVDAIQKTAKNKTVTTNGMKAFLSTKNACVDLFYKIGASRGQDMSSLFLAAYNEDREIALRILQWARDIRGGAGQRQVFRDLLNRLSVSNPEDAILVARKIPEIGRWDDLLALSSSKLRNEVTLPLIKEALRSGNGLAAKWMPRQGAVAAQLREAMGMSPKMWRKTLVELTKVVEQQMCAKDWDNINFSHVPSLAHSRYKKAFHRNSPVVYGAYAQALADKTSTVKINAGAVYPFDILKTRGSTAVAEQQVMIAQWDALPNYLGDEKILALVDVSGSMSIPVSPKSKVTAMDVAVSLGLYVADKLEGPFKDTFLTFSVSPKLLHLKGNILDKMGQMITSDWSMNTNLEAAFELILRTAVKGKVSKDQMPEILLIFSDMQFDQCVRGADDSALKMIRKQYEEAGYGMPKVVFWNLSPSYGNVPAKSDKEGVALVSGFSPAIVKSILSAADFSPAGIMLETVMVPRYDLT